MVQLSDKFHFWNNKKIGSQGFDSQCLIITTVEDSSAKIMM